MLNDIEVKFYGAMKINLMCLLLPLRLSPYWLDQLDLILTEQLVVNNIENKLTEPNMNVSSAILSDYLANQLFKHKSC